ncbi:metallophosphoesterase family protein [Bacillus sp. SD088]|uniref:metallophosphoesterase family protein n=1 Tax=Bacillus sp. SD088 TaxID=2782012 RepID=UPI001A96C8AA|nr:metallophosphoesterase [Bacillus sp. SD088]MBO0992893.1 metallophosphoesterase family protein [Bacillus sp. SD088]
MKIIYASDIHSNKDFYYQIYDLINNVQADAFILGGDLFAYSTLHEEQLTFMEVFLIPFFKSINIPVSLIAGNTDLYSVFKELRNRLNEEQYQFLSNKPHKIGSRIPIFGFPIITPSPFKLKNYFERRDLANDHVICESSYIVNQTGEFQKVSRDFLNALPSIEEEINTFSVAEAIWVTHVPPSGGVLDLLRNKQTAGSKAIRQKIMKEKPILSLHGHIHESPRMSGKWYEEIGETLSINPGQGNELHAVIIDIDSTTMNVKHTVFGEISKPLLQ